MGSNLRAYLNYQASGVSLVLRWSSKNGRARAPQGAPFWRICFGLAEPLPRTGNACGVDFLSHLLGKVLFESPCYLIRLYY